MFEPTKRQVPRAKPDAHTSSRPVPELLALTPRARGLWVTAPLASVCFLLSGLWSVHRAATKEPKAMAEPKRARRKAGSHSLSRELVVLVGLRVVVAVENRVVPETPVAQKK